MADDSELCKSRRRKELIVDGIELEQPETVLETLCKSAIVRDNKPIKLHSYNKFLKIEGSYWQVKPNEKVHRIFSNTFSLLPNLTSLVISQVDLEVLEPSAFRGLENLRYLNLYRNQLKELPTGIFDDTPNLIYINLDDNKIEQIEKDTFGKLVDLQVLKFALNKLTRLPEGWCSNLKNLRYLGLTTNNLKTIESGAFEGLSNLKELDLGVNGMENIEKDGFKGLEKLEKLSLIYNSHINVDLVNELANMPELKVFALCSDRLETEVYRMAKTILDDRNVEIHDMGAQNSVLEVSDVERENEDEPRMMC